METELLNALDSPQLRADYDPLALNLIKYYKY